MHFTRGIIAQPKSVFPSTVEILANSKGEIPIIYFTSYKLGILLKPARKDNFIGKYRPGTNTFLMFAFIKEEKKNGLLL